MNQAPSVDFDPRRYFARIDILRGFAATIVMLYHIVVISNFATFPNTGIFRIIRNGWMGVDLFFVISGFVITLSLSREELGNYKRARLNFMTRRWFRIAPLYYFTILIFIAFLQPHLLFLSAKSAAAHFGTHAVFMHNLIPQTHGSIVGPNWTVALEMQFYLLMALLLPKLFIWKKINILILFVSLAWVWRFSTTQIFEPGSSDANTQSIFSQMLPGTLDEFSIGIFIALCWLKSKDNEQGLSRFFLRKSSLFALYFASFLIMFWFSLLILENINYWSSTLMIVFYRTGLAVSFGLLLMAVITFPRKASIFEYPLMYLGKISFGIYLWHIIVLSTLLEKMPWLVGYKLLGVATLITLLLSSASYHLIEKPMIAKGSLIVKSRKNGK